MPIPALSALSPFGPIFAKELRVTARRKRTYFLRFIYLGTMLLFLLSVYLGSRSSYGYGGAAWRQQQQAELGREFFMLFSMFGVIAMGALGPVLTSTAIGSERLHKTLPVLLMTPITSWQIVSGKLFSRLLVALTLIGLSLPVLAVVRLLGGVEAEQMLAVVSLSIVTAMTAAALGLLFSTLMNRAYAVILLSYAAMLLAYLFVPMITALFLARSANSPAFMQFLCATNPFFSTGLQASGDARMMSMSPWVWCVVLHLGLTALLLVLSAALVRRIGRRAGEQKAGGRSGVAASPAPALAPGELNRLGEAGRANAAEPAGARATAMPADRAPAVASGTGGQLRRQRTVGDNPVLWREVRRPLMASRWQALVGALACVALLLLSYAALANDWRALTHAETQIVYASIFQGLLTLLACVMAGTAIAQEKEGDTWTLLLATPVGAQAIVWGKFLGMLRRMLWPFVLVAGHFLVFTLAGVIPLHVLLMVLWIIGTFSVIWIATGLYLSLRLSKVTLAVILNLALPLLVYAMVPLLLAILGELAAGTGRLSELVCWYLPYYYLGAGIEGLAGRPPGQVHRFWMPIGMPGEQYQASAAEFLFIVLVVGGLHLAATGAILWRTSRRFDDIVGRAPQRQPNVR